jgi:hypothetical protein
MFWNLAANATGRWALPGNARLRRRLGGLADGQCPFAQGIEHGQIFPRPEI